MHRIRNNPQRASSAALATVFLIVLVDLLGFGIVLPLLPFYAAWFHARAPVIGLLYAVYSLMQLVFSPIWGSLSDRIGRKPVMMMSTLGSTLSYLVFAFAGSLGLLFGSRIIAGIMGGNIAAVQAYISDVTGSDERTKGMGLIGAAFGLGFVLGPACAAFFISPAFPGLLEQWGWQGASNWVAQNPYTAPGLFASGLSFLSFLMALLRLPESNPHLDRAAEKEPMALRSLWMDRFRILRVSGRRTAGPAILPLLFFSVFILTLGQSSLYSSFPLFCTSQLKLSQHEIGLQFAWMGLLAVLIQGGLMRILPKRIDEKALFLMGNVLMPVGLGLIPLANSFLSLLGSLSILAMGGSLANPALMSLISKEAPEGQTGNLMGIAQSSAGLGRVIGPLWGGLLYEAGPRLPFLLTALAFSSTILVARLLRTESARADRD